MRFPTDITDMVVTRCDIDTKIVLHDQLMLAIMVNPITHKNILKEIWVHCKSAHRIALLRCLSLLPYHVWNDGTPVKKHNDMNLPR
jgi:hypothetical protein